MLLCKTLTSRKSTTFLRLFPVYEYACIQIQRYLLKSNILSITTIFGHNYKEKNEILNGVMVNQIEFFWDNCDGAHMCYKGKCFIEIMVLFSCFKWKKVLSMLYVLLVTFFGQKKNKCFFHRNRWLMKKLGFPLCFSFRWMYGKFSKRKKNIQTV